MVSSMGLAAIMVAYIFLLVPFTIYIGNMNEFTVSYGAMVQAYVPAMIFVIIVFGLLGMLLPVPIYNRYVTLLAAAGILFWIQGNLFVWDYGLLDGREIDWSSDGWRGWVDTGVWVVVILLAVVFQRSYGRQIITAAVLLFVLQLCVFVYNWAAHSSELAKKSEPTQTNHSADKFFQFSSKKNVLHIIADGFQTDIFEDIIADSEQGDDVSASLDGFISSKIYRNHVPINDFMESVFGSKSILDAAYDAGYDVDMVVPGGLMYMYKKGRYTNLSTVPGQTLVSNEEHEARGAAKLLDLSLFRQSPHFIKEHIYNDQLWLLQSFLTEKKFMGIKYFVDKAFLRKLHENISIDRKKPVYKYLHLMLSHNPMVTNDQCEYAGKVLPTVRETVKNQARCGLIEILKLFEEMKKAGIYDDTLIILMADHGAWVPPKGLTGIPQDDGQSIKVLNPQIMALAQPLLAIKRPGETGALRISDAPTSIIDTAATIADAMDLDTEFDGLSVFELGQSETRERKHFVYQYQRSEWTDQYLSPIQEFSVNGKGVDSSSWQARDIYLPGGIVRKSQGKSSLWQKVKIHE
jgi:hypothetical protein